MVNREKLNFWIKNRYNVLFIGKHGVGKTSIVKEAFEKANLNWMYFSASTMDPWVDMVGVPKEKIAADGSSYLDLIRPKEFQNDEIEALFFDEFNRSHKKIRNAVMELIQFKSINGKKFHNLKVVWAAINPEDEDEYDVEKLDPAQEDRFQIKIKIPYEPELSYFSNKYGKSTAKGAVSWWTALSTEQRNTISPRRLDYALDIFSKNGDLRDVLPFKSNVSKLITLLQLGPIEEILEKFIDTTNTEEARKFLQVENNFSAAIPVVLKKPGYINFFIPLISNEKLISLMSKNARIVHHVTSSCKKIPHYDKVIDEIIKANQSKKLVNKLQSYRNSVKKLKNCGSKPVTPWFNRDHLVHTNYILDVEDIIKKLKKYGWQTNTRKNLWNRLIYNVSIPRYINHQEAEKIVEVCNLVAGNSQIKTLNNALPHFYGVLNHALNVLYKHYQTNWLGLNFKLANIKYKMNTSSSFASKILTSKMMV